MTKTARVNVVQADDRPLFRLGGAMAVCGAAVAFVGNALHPRSTEYYGDPVAWLNHQTQMSIWFLSHVLILLGMIALVGGFVALSRSLAGTRGYGIGHLALANALVGSALIMVTLAIDGLVVAQLVDVWKVTEAPSPDAILAASIMYHTIFSLLYLFMISLFGLAPIFYGIAMLLSKVYASWFSWAGVLIGSSAVITGLFSMCGIASEFLDAVVWSVVASLFSIWFLIIGVLLWRRAGDVPLAVEN
jgi:hypothetical protein